MILVDLHSEICLNEEDLREGSELPHDEGGGGCMYTVQ
jgi:hypothetical protein